MKRLKLHLAPKIFILLFLLLVITGCQEKREETPKVTQLTLPKVAQVKPKVSSAQTVIKPVPKIKVTFVELGSVKCIPCKMMQPIMDEIAEEYKGQVKVVFYDVWTEAGQPYAKKYRVRSIPTQVFLDEKGEEFYRHVGFLPKDELVKVLKLKGVK